MTRKVWMMAVGLLLAMGLCAAAQETQSVLINPPPAAEQAQPVQIEVNQNMTAPAAVPQPTWLIRRGLFGWRAEPVMLQPVQVMVVQRPHVVWTPTIVWK